MNQVRVPLARGRESLAEILRKCSQNLLSDEGKQVHGAIYILGYERDLMLGNDLIDMYVKCGKQEDAHYVFDQMPERNVVSWTALMCGYLQAGNARASLLLFNEMGGSYVRPNEYTLSTNIKACGVLGALETGEQMHSMSLKIGLQCCPFAWNSIVDMYLKCGRIMEAERMFDEMTVRSLVTWNVMIAGYTQCEGLSYKALHFLKKMQEQGEKPDDFTLSSALKACRSLGAVREGKEIHAFLIRQGYPIMNHTILSGALVNLYALCKCLSEAQKVFDRMKSKSHVSWSALIVGYAQNGCLPQAIDLFRQLRWTTVSVESFVLSRVISLLANTPLGEVGKQLHSYTIKIPSNLDTSVANSILDMYLKCGLTHDAEKLFHRMPEKNVVSYTAMTTGYGKHGRGKEALQLFKQMQVENIDPDEVTYLGVLSACSHSGLVEESQECLTSMCNDHRIKPKVEHYASVVDALGRTGRLKEAKELIERMPVRPNVGIWQTLLNACRLHKNVEMGREVGDVLMRMDGDNVVNYVLLSNMFADVGCWKECERLRRLAKAKGWKKEAGISW